MTQVSITVNGKVRKAHVEPRTAARALPARTPQSHRHPRRLRHQPVRRLHGAHRRPQRQVVHGVRGAGRRLDGHHDRGARQGRPAAPAAGRLLGRARPAVRLLHAGHDHVGGQPAQRQPEADRSSRSAKASPATSAAAPAISTSSTPCSTPRARGSHGLTPVLPKLVGQRVKRREDPRLIQGLGTYVDDIKIAGMQHLAFKRSDVAHGTHHVDRHQRRARRWTASKPCSPASRLPSSSAPMPIGTPFPSPDHHAVAIDVVRYAGEPVAVVVAADRYVARDAADAIVVRYDTLPAVVDPELAMTGKPTRDSQGLPEQPGGARSCRAAPAWPPTAPRGRHGDQQGVRRRGGRRSRSGC